MGLDDSRLDAGEILTVTQEQIISIDDGLDHGLHLREGDVAMVCGLSDGSDVRILAHGHVVTIKDYDVIFGFIRGLW